MFFSVKEVQPEHLGLSGVTLVSPYCIHHVTLDSCHIVMFSFTSCCHNFMLASSVSVSDREKDMFWISSQESSEIPFSRIPVPVPEMDYKIITRHRCVGGYLHTVSFVCELYILYSVCSAQPLSITELNLVFTNQHPKSNKTSMPLWRVSKLTHMAIYSATNNNHQKKNMVMKNNTRFATTHTMICYHSL